MNGAVASPGEEAAVRRLLIDTKSKRIPFSVPLLNQCQYVERMVHRLLCGWGRWMKEWDGKATIHRHVWDQAEIIRRLRVRIGAFPGGKPDVPVAPAFEQLATAALLAPSFEDALDGIYKIILQALVKAYVDYVQHAHPIHDAPSLSLFHEINTIKEQHFFWYRAYRRRNPHTTNRAYQERVEQALEEVQALKGVVAFTGDGADVPCRPRPEFVVPAVSSREAGWAPEFNLYPYISADFADNIEARRLFWGIAYLQEMNVPDEQLLWSFYGDYMPWDWHYDISRHLWDESRHGCSGYSRLQDWGITMRDVGFAPYTGSAPHLRRHQDDAPLIEKIVKPFIDEAQVDFSIPIMPLTRAEIYEQVFRIGLVAETGHFTVKNESYDDFREANDLESAEMMLFDIIDETAHVQYAYRWLPMLAEQAGLDNRDHKQRALDERKWRQEGELSLIEQAKTLPRTEDFPAWRHYQNLLARVRKACPIEHVEKFTNRSPKPM